METKEKYDPENYHKMSEAFESKEVANQALRDFYDDVYAARNKHKVANVLIIVKDSAVYEDGEIGQFMNLYSCGDALNALPMCAFAYGELQQRQRELLNKLMAGK